MNNQRKPVNPDEWLYRRAFCNPSHKYLNPDGTATSRVFKLRPKDDGALSVDVKSLTTYEKSILDPERFMLFEIANEDVLSINLTTAHDPLEDNPSHAVILGMELDDDILPGLLARKSKKATDNNL